MIAGTFSNSSRWLSRNFYSIVLNTSVLERSLSSYIKASLDAGAAARNCLSLFARVVELSGSKRLIFEGGDLTSDSGLLSTFNATEVLLLNLLILSVGLVRLLVEGALDDSRKSRYFDLTWLSMFFFAFSDSWKIFCVRSY